MNKTIYHWNNKVFLDRKNIFPNTKSTKWCDFMFITRIESITFSVKYPALYPAMGPVVFIKYILIIIYLHLPDISWATWYECSHYYLQKKNIRIKMQIWGLKSTASSDAWFCCLALYSLARFSLALLESYLGIHFTKLFWELPKDKE